ncbi:anti-adapter protein IraM [Klebsiella michiganensis]|nr:anti-adapter protein IraM [Klebsiella michiganensis]
MQWNIENSLVCPVTGTGFSVAASAKNLKLIIWYSGDYFLSIGSVINITQNEVFINGVPGDLQVIHAFPYTENLWSTFSKNIECPGNQNPMLLICNREASASSPCAPTAPGKRGRNKASPSFALAYRYLFSMWARAVLTARAHIVPHPVPLMRNASARI